eukprot:scaffold249072_cov30-Tisochrysis_lutea.AAC.2
MHVAAQLLMILLSQPAPLVSRQVPMGASQDVAAAPHHLSDKMSRLLGGLQRPETLQFLVGGFRLLLRNGYASRRTYLPSALVELDCLQELLLLLWRFLSLNRRFAETLLDAPEVADVVLSLCYFILSWCDDDAKHSWVHLNVLCLLILSAEQVRKRRRAICRRRVVLGGARAARYTCAAPSSALSCSAILPCPGLWVNRK